MKPKRIDVLGVPMDVVDMPKAIETADALINSTKTSCCILAVNPLKILHLRKDDSLLQFYHKAALLIPDGIGAVWASRMLLGINTITRVTGADLMLNLCSLAAKNNYKVFIYGSREEVSSRAAQILRSRYPGMELVGRQNGYLPPEKMGSLVKSINESSAQILFVALGSPQQEQWISQFADKLQVKVIQGIGGSLDTITGHVKRAPLAWQNLRLEWFYRLVHEPKRIRRHIWLPYFVCIVLWKKMILGRTHLVNYWNRKYIR